MAVNERRGESMQDGKGVDGDERGQSPRLRERARWRRMEGGFRGARRRKSDRVVV